jgi:hypothetical protein
MNAYEIQTYRRVIFGIRERSYGDGWDRLPAEVRDFFSSKNPDRLWGLSSLLPNGYRGLFLQGKAAGV